MELISRGGRRQQRGLSLIFALLALAALTMGTMALINSANIGSLLIGNLGFQQEATALADNAAQQAITSLSSQLSASSTSLGSGQESIGYYASHDDLIDVTGAQLSTSTRKLVKWDDDYCDSQQNFASCAYVPVAISSVNGNSASYVVFRMCDRTGDPVSDSTINCARPLTASTVSGTNEVRDYNAGAGTSSSIASPYYRIVVRVVGGRNTTSYTETIVHF